MSQPGTDTVAEDLAAILAANADWSDLSGCTVLVTGAAGFLGNYIVRTLLALNASSLLDRAVHVVAMVRTRESGEVRFSDLQGQQHLQLVAWDLSGPGVPELPAVDYVIHAASQASPRFYGADPVGTMLPNILGTAALLRAVGSGLKGFLFISSSEVYGTAGESAAALREDCPGTVDPMSPRSCYAEGKRAGETLCVAWHTQYGVPTYIVRPFHTYGPGLKAEDGRVFADFIYNAVRGEDISIRSDGRARRAYCYISDAISGLFLVLLRGEPATAYNLGNPDAELSVAELAELVAGARVGGALSVRFHAPPETDGYMKSHVDRIVPNIDRLKALGWQPLVPPEVGFSRTVYATDND